MPVYNINLPLNYLKRYLSYSFIIQYCTTIIDVYSFDKVHVTLISKIIDRFQKLRNKYTLSYNIDTNFEETVQNTVLTDVY